MDVDRPGRDGPATDLGEELRCAHGRRREAIWVGAALEAHARLRAQPEPARASSDPLGIEVRGFEQYLGRALPYFGVGAAHDPRDGDRTFGVTDRDVVLR